MTELFGTPLSFKAVFMASKRPNDALEGKVNSTALPFSNCLATDSLTLSSVTKEASPPGIAVPSFQSVTVTLSIMALSLPIFNL